MSIFGFPTGTGMLYTCCGLCMLILSDKFKYFREQDREDQKLQADFCFEETKDDGILLVRHNETLFLVFNINILSPFVVKILSRNFKHLITTWFPRQDISLISFNKGNETSSNCLK